MSVTATLLMEQYISRFAIPAAPHADDVAGLEVSRFVAKSLSAHPGSDPSGDEPCKGVQVVSLPSYYCDYGNSGYSQLPFICEGFSVDADVVAS